MITGYTNASLTMKCDLTAEYICPLLNYMDQHRLRASKLQIITLKAAKP
jgi:hypothetical protein